MIVVDLIKNAIALEFKVVDWLSETDSRGHPELIFEIDVIAF